MTKEEKAESKWNGISFKYTRIEDMACRIIKDDIIKVYLDGLAEGREEKCNSCGLRQQKRVNLEKENAELKKHIDEIKKYKICPRCTRSDVQKLEKGNAELKKQEEILLDRILTLQKTNGSLTDKINMLEEQIEKMRNIIYEEVDFCSYCPYKDCKNDEGTCPCANISKEEQVEILTEWITKNGS